MRSTALLSAILLFTAGAGHVSVHAPPSDPPQIGDRAALASIVMYAVRDVQLCDLAVERTRTAAVRSFCRDAVPSRARTALDGMQLAARLGASDVRFEAQPGTDTLLATLSDQSGHDFDRAFLLAQIEDHETDEDAIRYAAEVAVDHSVKRYEDAVLPQVEHLLQLAEGSLEAVSRDQP